MHLEFEYTFDDYQEAAKYRSPVKPGRATLNVLMVACAVIVVAGVAVQWLFLRPPANASLGADDESSLSTWVVWGLLFTVIWVIAFLVLRRGGKSEWESHAGLFRRQAVDVLPDRLTFWDPAHRAEYLWPYFAAFRESKSLFILYPYDTSTRIIPKRALPDPTQLDWLRGLLHQAIGRNT